MPAEFLPDTCGTGDLARIFNVSPRAVQDYKSRGIIVPAAGRGRYQTIPSIHGYLAHLREQAAGRADDGGASLVSERVKTEQVNRALTQLKLDELKGEVLPLDEVTASWSNFATMVRSAVMTLPSKLRAVIPHLTAHDSLTIKTVCRDILDELADEVEDSVIHGDPKDVKVAD